MMNGKGLTKLMEECGELVQVAAKKLAYMDTDFHPDEKGSLKIRLEEEMGDVMGAIHFVELKLGLSYDAISERCAQKLRIFQEWDRNGDDVLRPAEPTPYMTVRIGGALHERPIDHYESVEGVLVPHPKLQDGEHIMQTLSGIPDIVRLYLDPK